MDERSGVERRVAQKDRRSGSRQGPGRRRVEMGKLEFDTVFPPAETLRVRPVEPKD